MATVLLFAARFPGEKWIILQAIVVAVTIQYLAMTQGRRIYRLLGKRGSIAVTRLLGMILVVVSVQMIIDGLRLVFAK